ncbi:MAG: hypothetical protein J6L86_00040 [Alphaproteobacteria bacterium]|nr:hypothetical protein [Alphaproteobacteria bacterium]
MKKSTLFISAAATVMVIGMATGIYCYYQARNSIYGAWHPAQQKSGQDIFSGRINIIKINPDEENKDGRFTIVYDQEKHFMSCKPIALKNYTDTYVCIPGVLKKDKLKKSDKLSEVTETAWYEGITYLKFDFDNQVYRQNLNISMSPLVMGSEVIDFETIKLPTYQRGIF